MAKDTGRQRPAAKSLEGASRRKRRISEDSNGSFLLALADALRDILLDERRRAA